jgi:glycogen(starch) synthase
MRTSNTSIKRSLRILYALGPGNAVDSYRHWKTGEELQSETSKTFSGQFFEFCRRGGHRAYVISSFLRPEKIHDDGFVVENRPKRPGKTGIRYHISQALYAMSIMVTALTWRAHIVVVDSGTTHWAFFAPLKIFRICTVGMLHNVPWPAGYRPDKGLKKIFLLLEGWFWRHIAKGLLSVSPECERQVRELAGELRCPAFQVRAQFNPADFAPLYALPQGRMPFRILYAGRIVRPKGVFDIVKIAAYLEKTRPGSVKFDVCGGGPDLNQLDKDIRSLGLDGAVTTYGKLDRAALLQRYSACHAVIVPTRSDFCEGMPMVCAEAILCSRPVITSRLSNALDVLQGALAIADPDNPRSYADVIQRLVSDPAQYELLRSACPGLQKQFYDFNMSLTGALESLFATPSFSL